MADYVTDWYQQLSDKTNSRGERIRVHHKFSVDIAARVKRGVFTDSEIFHGLQRYLKQTPARQVIRLSEIDKKTVEFGAKYADKGGTGATISHLFYVLKLDKGIRAEQLRLSIDNGLSIRAFKSQVDNIASNKNSRKPSIAINQLGKSTEDLLSLITEVTSPGFVDQAKRMNPERRDAAREVLTSTIGYLKSIRVELPELVKRLQELKCLP